MRHPLPGPPLPVRLGLAAVRTAALAAIVLLALMPGPGGGRSQDGGPAAVVGRQPAVVQRLIDRHHCSTTGFARAVPASALVRSPGGRLRLVDLDRGWEVHTLRTGTTLVAVCLDPPHS